MTRNLSLVVGGLCLSLLPACGLVQGLLCRPTGAVLDFSLLTPEATFESFKAAVKANNPAYEYRCLSARLLDEHDITLSKYSIGRSTFFRKYRREVDGFLRSRIVGIEYDRTFEYSRGGHETAFVVLSDEDRRGVFQLINEPYYEIWYRGPLDEFEHPDSTWGSIDQVGETVVSADARDLILRIPLDQPLRALPGDIVGIQIQNEWKVLNFYGLNEDSFWTETRDEDGPAP